MVADAAAVWESDRRIAARRGGCDSGQHVRQMIEDDWPHTCGQLDQCDLSLGEVLLIADVAVTGDQDREASGLGSTDQRAVFGCRPSHPACGDDLVSGQCTAKTERCVLIEQDANRHSRVSSVPGGVPDVRPGILNDPAGSFRTQTIEDLAADLVGR